jgi:hypothetical protein
MEDAERELWEIEENLCRADLTELERGEHLARRKEIYETVHPETRRGANVGPQRHFVATEQPAFSEDTANKIGIDKRTVQRSIRRAEKIDEKVRDRIRDTPEIADSGVELDALAQLAPDQQGKAVALVKKGNATSIRHAKRILGVAPTPNKGAPPPPDMKPEEPAASTRSAKEQEILPGVFDQSISAPFTGGDPANPASAPEMVAKAVREFVAKAILHGDEGQRAWLLDAAECFLAGKPMPDPPPSGPRALTDEELKRLMNS